MIEYRVTITIDSDVAAQWYAWMRDDHIPEVLQTGFFTQAQISRLLEGQEERPTYQITYLAASHAAYEQYAREKAPALQQDHNQRYGGRFQASRSLSELLETVVPV